MAITLFSDRRVGRGESLEYWKELGVEGNQIHFISTRPKSPAPPPLSPWRFVMTVP